MGNVEIIDHRFHFKPPSALISAPRSETRFDHSSLWTLRERIECSVLQRCRRSKTVCFYILKINDEHKWVKCCINQAKLMKTDRRTEEENKSYPPKMAGKRGQLIMTVIGSFSVIAGVLLVLFWPRIFDKILFKVSDDVRFNVRTKFFRLIACTVLFRESRYLLR